MAVILNDAIEITPSDRPAPVELLRQKPDLTCCAICACPCLTPRLPTPQPDDPDITPTTSDLLTPAWLHQFHHLQPTKGILPYPYKPIQQKGAHQAYTSPSQRVIPVHLYCLRAIIAITQPGMWNCVSDHPDSMMVGWTVPRWTGFGPWMKDPTARPISSMGWSGLADQKYRYIEAVEGSHLRSCDLVSPLLVDSYSEYAPPTPSPSPAQREQLSLLALMPPHIITTIAQNLLYACEPDKHDPAQQLAHLLAFCRTSQAFRQLHLPETTWSQLALAAVNRFRDEQCQRWRASPTGSGSVAPIWIAIDQNFVTHIEEALKEVDRSRDSAGSVLSEDTDTASVMTMSARDVLYWWLYSDAWRSRRRVWHCVIYACAAARNADWM